MTGELHMSEPKIWLKEIYLSTFSVLNKLGYIWRLYSHGWMKGALLSAMTWVVEFCCWHMIGYLFVCCSTPLSRIFVSSTRVMNVCQQCYPRHWRIWACHSYIPWGHHSVCNQHHCSLEWPALPHHDPAMYSTSMPTVSNTLIIYSHHYCNNGGT